MVTVNVVVVVLLFDALSFTVTVITAVPYCPTTGVYDNVPAAFGLRYVTEGFGISPGLFETAVTVSVCTSPGDPVPTPLKFTTYNPEFWQTAMGWQSSSVSAEYSM